MHAKTYSYHQACKDAMFAQARMRANVTPTTHCPIKQSVTRTARVVSYWMPLAPQTPQTPQTPPPQTHPLDIPAAIIRDPKSHTSASKGRNSGCVCIFCEHQFVREMRNVHQAERRARDFYNDTIHGDYCKNCLQSGGVMLGIDVAGQDLGVIRDMLMDLINAQNLVICIKSIID